MLTDEQLELVERYRKVYEEGNNLDGTCTVECLEFIVKELFRIIDTAKGDNEVQD